MTYTNQEVIEAIQFLSRPASLELENIILKRRLGAQELAAQEADDDAVSDED